MTIHDDLREVMGLLGLATDVRWLACERGFGDSDLWFDPYEDWCSYEDQLVRGAFKDADAQAIAAAVNFLRQHGPALIARQEGEDDSARLDYIERTFSGMTNRERYLPVQMIWGKGANGRSLREACDKYMAAEAARSGGGG